MSYGPFRDGLDPIERKAQLRCLRLAVKLLCGERGTGAAYQLLVAEVDCHPETIAEAAKEFDRLPSLDRRRVLSALAASLPSRPCFDPAKTGGNLIPRRRAMSDAP